MRRTMKTMATTPNAGGGADLTLTSRVHFRRGGKGRLELATGPRPVSDEGPAGGRRPAGCRRSRG